jgi:ankyrin repeat protein
MWYVDKLMLIMKRSMLLLALSAAALPALADPVRDLVLAAQLDSANSARKLLASGLSANTRDPLSGEPVMLVALREGADGVIGVLVADKEFNPELAAPNGNTPLMMAAYKHNKRAVQALLARGAAVDQPGWTALHYAAASGDTEIAGILLAHKAAIDAESPSKLTPLMMAAREGQEQCVALLLRAGANARLRNNENLSASQIALRAEKPAIAAAIDAFLATR